MKIYPREEMYGTYTVPSDKAITLRAIMLGSVAKGKTYIVNPLICGDTLTAVSCAKKIGAKVKVKDKIIEIKGTKAIKSGLKIDCGNSATVMRMMCGMIAGSGVSAVLSGDRILSHRQMKGVKEPLEMMGATVALTDYSVPPVWVDSSSVRPIDYEMHYYNSHVKSAILSCALLGKVRATIREHTPTCDHTEILLSEMGADITTDKSTGVTVLGVSEIKGKKIHVSGDFSSAAYLLALGVLLGKVTVRNVGVNPLRTGIISVLRRMGAKIEIKNRRILCGEVFADVTAYKSSLKATHVTVKEVAKMSDDVSILCVLMGLAEGESIISGGDFPFHKNEERLTFICDTINSIGGKCHRFSNGIVINGVKSYVGGNVKTYGDHRIAMSAAVALTVSENGGEIDDAECVNVSFPGFFQKLKDGNVAVIGKERIAKAACDMNEFILDSVVDGDHGTCLFPVTDDSSRKCFNELKSFGAYQAFYPYCQEALRHAAKLSGQAKTARCVNFLRRNKGYTTDGEALVGILKNEKYDCTGKTALVIGCGNAARSVIFALIAAKMKVDVYARGEKTVSEIRKKTGDRADFLDKFPETAYDVVVNATPVGSGFYEDELPVPEGFISKCGTAVDLAYSDDDTEFISMAKSHGIKTIDGKKILFYSLYIADCIAAGRMFSEEKAAALSDGYFGTAV